MPDLQFSVHKLKFLAIPQAHEVTITATSNVNHQLMFPQIFVAQTLAVNGHDMF